MGKTIPIAQLCQKINTHQPPPKRRLAAILFADIAGYTAMMQNNEAEGLRKVEHYRQVLEEKVVHYHGEILQHYGDGSLCIFSSGVAPVRCAKEIQIMLREVPEVPVRIGIHIGDIVIKGNDIYGNGVNLASRVESLGVPGSVLITRRLLPDLKSHPELSTISLGQFHFKNVNELMEVFALTGEGFPVPKREEMKGKLKEKIPAKRSALRTWLIPLLTLLLGATGVFFWQNGNAKDQLPADILESRIAVLPYENQTNDPDLDALGNMAADWITRTLINLEDTKVVQFDNVKDHLELAEQTAKFAKQTGAERLIRGRFYLEGEEVIFESQIVDPQTSEVVFVLPTVRGAKDQPSVLVSELGERIGGYFAIQESFLFSASFGAAPKYEAFVLYEQAYKFFGTDYDRALPLFQEAIAKDSNFMAAYFNIAVIFSNQGDYATADSILQDIKERFPNPSKSERYYMDVFSAMFSGNLEKKYDGMKPLFDIDPKDFQINYMMAYGAFNANRPQAAIDAFQYFDPLAIDFKRPSDVWWFEVYANALIRLDSLEEAKRIISMVPEDKTPDYDYYTWQLIYTLQNEPDSLDQLIQKMENKSISDDLLYGVMASIIADYAVAGQSDQQVAWGKKMVSRLQNRPESVPLNSRWLADAYYYAGEFEQALIEYENLPATAADPWIVPGYLYARLGQRDKALAYIQELGEKETPYSHGQFKYAQAQVYSGLGEKEKAVQLMKQAYREGHSFRMNRYGYAFEFIPLQGYAPFEAFVRPK